MQQNDFGNRVKQMILALPEIKSVLKKSIRTLVLPFWFVPDAPLHADSMLIYIKKCSYKSWQVEHRILKHIILISNSYGPFLHQRCGFRVLLRRIIRILMDDDVYVLRFLFPWLESSLEHYWTAQISNFIFKEKVMFNKKACTFLQPKWLWRR